MVWACYLCKRASSWSDGLSFWFRLTLKVNFRLKLKKLVYPIWTHRPKAISSNLPIPIPIFKLHLQSIVQNSCMADYMSELLDTVQELVLVVVVLTWFTMLQIWVGWGHRCKAWSQLWSFSHEQAAVPLCMGGTAGKDSGFFSTCARSC